MSMFTTLKDDPTPTQAKMLKSLDGNLCRCTGYRSIIDAAKTFCSDCEAPRALTNRDYAPFSPHEDPTIHFGPPDGKTMHISGKRSEWYAPQTLGHLLELKNSHPHAKIIGGNTELGIEGRYQGKEYPMFFAVNNIPELHRFQHKDGVVEFGGAITLTHLWEKLEVLRGQVPAHQQRAITAITDQLQWFSGTPIRNMASVSGNVMNASPISDLNPVWVALNARFHLASVKGARTVPAAEFFGPKYKQTAASPNEVLAGVSFNLTDPDEYIESYKQGQRREDDIAIVNASMYLKLGAGKVIHDARLAYGGMAPATLCDRPTATLLVGRTLDWPSIKEVDSLFFFTPYSSLEPY
jgi:xanthine dehydrogenase/oxidase